MKPIRWEPVVVAVCSLTAGCASVSLTPGADQIKVTDVAADVAACAPLGHLAAAQVMMTDPDAERQMRNETLDLGGNTLLLTPPLNRTGIAYRCGDARTPSARAPAPQAAMAVKAPAEVVQAQIDAYNRRDIEGILSSYADDAQIFYYPDQLTMSGKDALRDGFRKLFEPAPQLHASILHRIAFDRFVIDQQQVTGRPDGQVIQAVAIYEIRDGRIVRVTFLHR
jgi:hypothetical protein